MKTTDNKQQPKIAIMLMVHKNEAQANRLIKHLAEDFDVYVHIDKRSSVHIQDLDSVFVYKKYAPYWASFNIVKATLHLLSEAYKRGYDRYILISAQDLPLRTNAEIRVFFENNNCEYIDIQKISASNMKRVTQYWSHHINIISKALFKLFSTIKRRPIDYDFYKGAQWMNLTHNCVEKIFLYLNENEDYIKRYEWTHCADELFFHTIIHQLDGLEIKNKCLRYIDWQSGGSIKHPKTLRMEDYETIRGSNQLFARKFDTTIDKEIVDLIYATI
ncbi:glycosyltransferase [Candidatus Symbiothrix dinenymphae]|nr:glycosyltransferase [Candidatus Symbiothrix dinenymphae]